MPSSMRVSVKAILRGCKFKFSDANSKARISRLFDKMLSKPMSNLNSTVRTWEGTWEGDWVGAIPYFEIETIDTVNRYLKKIVLSGDEIGIEKWSILDEGTDTRWAVMDKDYKRKTYPRQFKSRAGGGNVAIRGREAMLKRGIPPKSIEARGWSEMVNERLENEVDKYTDDILDAVTDLL